MTEQKKNPAGNKASDKSKARRTLPKTKELKNTQSMRNTAGGIGGGAAAAKAGSYYCSNNTVCDH